jgi:hypothetical protein
VCMMPIIISTRVATAIMGVIWKPFMFLEADNLE